MRLKWKKLVCLSLVVPVSVALLYVFSVGPVVYLLERNPGLRQTWFFSWVLAVYGPLESFAQAGFMGQELNDYADFWRDLASPNNSMKGTAPPVQAPSPAGK